MRRAPAVLLILLVIYGFLSPPCLPAQQIPAEPPATRQAQGFRLEQNNPNPVDGETWIPFVLEESLFQRTDTRLVTIQIYNLLNQLVAVPRAPDHPRGKNLPVQNLPYTEAGRKVARWDARDTQGRRVPSGVYYLQMVVNDQPPQMKKIIVNPRRRSRIPIPWFGDRGRS
ncbi:MAG TPA: hypothetical protein VF263_08025, partial [Longimicrobiaceae bacterium]